MDSKFSACAVFAQKFKKVYTLAVSILNFPPYETVRTVFA